MAGTPITAFSVAGTVILLHGRAANVTDGTVFNTTAGQGYLQLFDVTAAAAVTLGTTPAYHFVPVSPGDNDTIRSGNGFQFTKGIAVATTTTPTGATGATCHLTVIVE